MTDVEMANARDNSGVTVCVITFNQEQFVDDALASLVAQTLSDFDVLIIDDASTDGTVGRISAWLPQLPATTRLVVNRRNRGLCANKNFALREIQSEFICSLSGDDFYEPPRLEHQLARFRALGPEVAVLFGNARLVTEDGEDRGAWYNGVRPLYEGRVFDALLQLNFIRAPSAMVRCAAVRAVGGYDESLFAEDYDMWLRLADRFEFRYLDEIVVNNRIGPASMSRHPTNAGRMRESTARAKLKWLGRSPETDALISREAWAQARRVFALDPRRGRRLLRDVLRAVPTRARRAQAVVAAVPGTATPLRWMLRWHDRHQPPLV